MTLITRLKDAAQEAERALADLATRRERLVEELEYAEASSAGADFAAFAATGELAVASRSAERITAEIAHVDALAAAGRARVAGLQHQAKQAQRAEQAARIAAMTMPDAIEFARDALSAVDLDAARAEIGRIEEQIERLDQPRLAARDTYSDINHREHDLLRRYRGQPDQRTGATPEQARAATADALKQVTDLRDRMRSLQRLHEQAREDLTSAVSQALAHVGRLAVAAGAEAEKRAAAVTTFGRAVAAARPTFPALPTAPAAADLPSAEEVAELRSLAEPILALARRAPPPGRPESEYLAPALR